VLLDLNEMGEGPGVHRRSGVQTERRWPAAGVLHRHDRLPACTTPPT
jgi:hypothetical protein